MRLQDVEGAGQKARGSRDGGVAGRPEKNDLKLIGAGGLALCMPARRRGSKQGFARGPLDWGALDARADRAANDSRGPEPGLSPFVLTRGKKYSAARKQVEQVRRQTLNSGVKAPAATDLSHHLDNAISIRPPLAGTRFDHGRPRHRPRMEINCRHDDAPHPLS